MKNKHNLQRLIGGLILVVGIVLILVAALAFKSADEGIPLLVAGLIVLILGIIWYCIATSNSRKVCSKCGGKMAGCEYQYQEVSREDCGPSAPNSFKVTVHIIAICPHCGTQKSFDKKFQLKYGENPQYRVDQFCRNHFGH